MFEEASVDELQYRISRDKKSVTALQNLISQEGVNKKSGGSTVPETERWVYSVNHR
jgi:hypothetical protein